MTAPGSRCRSGKRCPDGEDFYDPDTGERIERVGVLMDDDGLCEACQRLTAEALRWLPVDYRDLSELLPPTGERHTRDPDIPAAPRIKLYAAMPLRADVLDLQILIDYEVRAWAGSVADYAGMWASGDWSSRAAARSRWSVRIEQSCQLLEHRLTQLLELRDVEHAARSLGAIREEGHDPDRTTRLYNEVLTVRHGWEAALLFRDLHERVERFCGRHPGERVMAPCALCHRRALVRHTPRPGEDHPANVVVCRCCGNRVGDNTHAAFLDEALRLFGIPNPAADYDDEPAERAGGAA